MVNHTKEGGIQVKLIDYGFASPFLNEDKSHISEGSELNQFKGNMLFASARQLAFMQTSRKDDLISVCYLMIYLLNGQRFPDNLQRKGHIKMTPFERLTLTKNYKQSVSIEALLLKVSKINNADTLFIKLLTEFIS